MNQTAQLETREFRISAFGFGKAKLREFLMLEYPNVKWEERKASCWMSVFFCTGTRQEIAQIEIALRGYNTDLVGGINPINKEIGHDV